MKNHIKLLALIFILLIACQRGHEKGKVDKWKSEIVETEQEFARMAKEKGIPEAFLTFAADEAVLMRNNILIIGKDSIRQSFENSKTDYTKITLSWEPDFVDVSASGDLGYTYGKYIYSVKDSLGKESVSEGIFHTVWKRQRDGKWRFVWD